MTARITLLALLLAAGGTLADESIKVEDIINKANLAAYYAGTDGRADVSMTIRDKDGGERQRSFSILRLSDKPGGNQKFYVYFHDPADVRKMAYLVWKQVDGDDDRWLWLPALNLKKRIAPGDKRTSFVGSDFLYEDVSGRNLAADTHVLSEQTDKYFVIKSTPRQPDDVEFAHYLLYIDRQTYLPIKAEYSDKQGRLYRRVEALEVADIQRHPTVIRARATDLLRGTSTENVFSNVKYDIGLKDSIFTERYLRRPPKEVR
jgi:hypothetical protein